MLRIGLRELRQDASAWVRTVEQGETVEVTVSGRPAARLVPVASRTWQRWDAIADIFDGAVDDGWQRDMALIDGEVVDPFGDR
ncbi:MAG: type II toxin-antitoxin system prevent-host-death family antitoxin [Acidimicrobiia bacterium]|nr:type II toxin-antitoxin system prevent-host-death family antitoxin [Acidimicrobiia bacterium]